MLALLSVPSAFSGSTPLPGARMQSSRAGPVAANMLDRRAVLGAAAAGLTALPPAFAAAPPASDGKWAQHDQDEAFTDEDFSGFSKSPTGLEYKVVQEGYG